MTNQFNIFQYEFGEINFYDMEYHALIEHDFKLSHKTTVLNFRRNGITYELTVTPSDLNDKIYEIKLGYIKKDGESRFEQTNLFQQFHIFNILIGMFEYLIKNNEGVCFSFVCNKKMNRIFKYIYNKRFSYLDYKESWREDETIEVFLTKI